MAGFVGVDLEHPCGAPDAQAFGQARDDAHDELDGSALAMKQCAEGLQKVAATGDAQQLPPWAPTGMAVGAQIPQAYLAPIRTIRMRTEMLRGVHLAFSATCGGDPWGWRSRRGDRGGLPSLLTRGARGLVGKASKRFRSARALTRGWNWGGWRVPSRPTFAGPDHMEHDEEPHENDQRQLIKNEV